MNRAKRLEFDKKTRLAIFIRAGGPGAVRCEGCGRLLKDKPFEVDHTLECWEIEDIEHGLRAPLTPEDGKLLGKACCHQEKSARKAGERAHCRRIVEKAAQVKKKSFFPGGRNSRFKKRMDGVVVDRQTGEPI